METAIAVCDCVLGLQIIWRCFMQIKLLNKQETRRYVKSVLERIFTFFIIDSDCEHSIKSVRAVCMYALK